MFNNNVQTLLLIKSKHKNSDNNWRETSVKQLYKSAFVKFFAAVKKTDIDCSSSSHAVGVHLNS